MPDHLNFGAFGTVPANGTSQWDSASNTMTWTWGFLAPGTYDFTYQANVDSATQSGTVLTNQAQVVYDNGKIKKASVSVTVGALYTVKVGVYNEAGELVKQIWVKELTEEITQIDLLQTPSITSLHGVVYVDVAGQPIASWDGTNQSGDPVTNGEYILKVDNINSLGADTSVSENVMVTRSIARVEVDVYDGAGEIVRHLYSYADDPNNTPLTDVKLSNTVIKPVAEGTPTPSGSGSVTITMPSGDTVVWDGKSDSGTVVTNGDYQIEVHFTDGKGGEETVSHGIIVESANLPSSVSAQVRPNIVTAGDPIQVRLNPVAGYILVASLYDVAGELIETQTGTQVDQVDLDSSKLASGLYIVRVKILDAQGDLAGQQYLHILVRH